MRVINFLFVMREFFSVTSILMHVYNAIAAAIKSFNAADVQLYPVLLWDSSCWRWFPGKQKKLKYSKLSPFHLDADGALLIADSLVV